MFNAEHLQVTRIWNFQNFRKSHNAIPPGKYSTYLMNPKLIFSNKNLKSDTDLNDFRSKAKQTSIFQTASMSQGSIFRPKLTWMLRLRIEQGIRFWSLWTDCDSLCIAARRNNCQIIIMFILSLIKMVISNERPFFCPSSSNKILKNVVSKGMKNGVKVRSKFSCSRRTVSVIAKK